MVSTIKLLVWAYLFLVALQNKKIDEKSKAQKITLKLISMKNARCNKKQVCTKNAQSIKQQQPTK